MSKKNMDALSSNIMGEAIERPTDITVTETTQPDKASLSSKEKRKMFLQDASLLSVPLNSQIRFRLLPVRKALLYEP